jgi:hypothetical protein
MAHGKWTTMNHQPYAIQVLAVGKQLRCIRHFVGLHLDDAFRPAAAGGRNCGLTLG